MEAGPPDLRHVAHDIPVTAEHVVAERPGHEIAVRYRAKPVLAHDLVPQRRLVRHELRERYRLHRSGFHLEEPGEGRPEVLPPEEIAVREVENLIGCRVAERRPLHRGGEV